VASFMLGPFWFNPLSFEWNRIKDDYVHWTAWMAEVGGTSEQSWQAWFREETKFYASLSLSWKVFLALQKATPWVLIGLGLAGARFLSSWEEQLRVLEVLGVFAFFIVGNWLIYKLERHWPYAVRRVVTLALWAVVSIVLITLFVNHTQYIRYSVGMYYVTAAGTYLLLLCGFNTQVMFMYKLHDYVVGHCIFVLLGVLAVFQVRCFPILFLFLFFFSSFSPLFWLCLFYY
jgi:callose synthase